LIKVDQIPLDMTLSTIIEPMHLLKNLILLLILLIRMMCCMLD